MAAFGVESLSCRCSQVQVLRSCRVIGQLGLHPIRKGVGAIVDPESWAFHTNALHCYIYVFSSVESLKSWHRTNQYWTNVLFLNVTVWAKSQFVLVDLFLVTLECQGILNQWLSPVPAPNSFLSNSFLSGPGRACLMEVSWQGKGGLLVGGGGCEGQEVRRDGLFVPTEGGNEEVSFKLRGIPKGTLGVPSASHKIKSTLYPSTDLRSRAAVYPSPMSRALLPLVQRLTAGR